MSDTDCHPVIGNGQATVSVLVAEGRELMRAGICSMLSSLGVRTRLSVASTIEETEAALAPPPRIDAVVVSAELYHGIAGGRNPPVPPLSRVMVMGRTKPAAEGVTRVEVATLFLVDEITVVGLGDALGRIVGSSVVRGRPSPPLPSLTRRESEVLRLIVEGLSNKHIAIELGISIHGVKRHVSNVLAKFDSESRTQVVARMLQADAAGVPYEPIYTPRRVG